MYRKFEAACRKRNIVTTCMECNEFHLGDFQNPQIVIFVISTSGQGNFPLNAKLFWDTLTKEEIFFSSLQYSIFGLGDSNFWKSNGTFSLSF